MSFETQTEVRGAVLFVKLIGLMDYSTVDNMKLEIPEHIRKIVVDFSRMDFIDSTGIGSLLSVIYTAGERNLDVEFEGLNDSTRELFETVGVFRIMEALLNGER